MSKVFCPLVKINYGIYNVNLDFSAGITLTKVNSALEMYKEVMSKFKDLKESVDDAMQDVLNEGKATRVSVGTRQSTPNTQGERYGLTLAKTTKTAH